MKDADDLINEEMLEGARKYLDENYYGGTYNTHDDAYVYHLCRKIITMALREMK